MRDSSRDTRHTSTHHQQQQQQQRVGTSSSLFSSVHHHARLVSCLSMPTASSTLGPLRQGVDPSPRWRSVVPGGHLLYRRPAACRSETASPVIDYDDDVEDDVSLSSPGGPRDRPWRVRRHLKAISERSQSSDTIYV